METSTSNVGDEEPCELYIPRAFELSPVPLAPAHCDGSLMSVLEGKVCMSARLPVEETETYLHSAELNCK